jgi:hypothetical protein
MESDMTNLDPFNNGNPLDPFDNLHPRKPTKVEEAMLRGKDAAPVPAVGITTREQRSAVASAIRSLRYGAHPLRSPHADELVRVFPEVDPNKD